MTGRETIEESFGFLENDIKACRFGFALHRLKHTTSLIDDAHSEKVINLREWFDFERRLDDTIKKADNCRCFKKHT